MDIKKAELAAFIKEARLKKKLSIPTLASRIGVGANTIYRWEGAESIPAAASFAMLAKELELDDKAKLAYAVVSGDNTLVGAQYDPETQFGKWLKQQRLIRGWNQRILADELHVAPGTVSLWESETTHPSAKTRDKIILKLLESAEETEPKEVEPDETPVATEVVEPETAAEPEKIGEPEKVGEQETLMEPKFDEIAKAIEDATRVVPSNRNDIADTLLGIAQMLKHLADLL